MSSQNVAAPPPVPVAPPTGGQKAIMKLWLLLATNPQLLLQPATAAFNNGKTTFNFVPSADGTVTTWAAFSNGLIDPTDAEADNFNGNTLQAFLTSQLQTSVLTLSPGHTITYAAALNLTCAIFQVIFPQFTGWGNPSPEDVSNVLDLD